MKSRLLGRSGIAVSEICLGSMTWGEQNTEADAHAQLDLALERGVNFIDTAELYSTIPVRPETYGRTEEIIGTWLAARKRRDDVIIASKVAGGDTAHIRGGAAVDASNIRAAIDGSLTRLQTDVIDLYQIHWPPRGHYHFRRQWDYDPSNQDTSQVIDNMVDCLEDLDRQIKAGKIRAIGLSNETCWGASKFLELSKTGNLPRIATIQNEYNLMYRLYDLDLAELSHHEDVALLAYSPLAAGLLTGKYSGGVFPPGSRGSVYDSLSGRSNDATRAIADAYVALAQEHGLHPVQMALAFCISRPFKTVPIIGATSISQLEVALGAAEITLSDDVLTGINALNRAHPNPY